MPRWMRDPDFRQTQWNDRYTTHVEPINRWVDAGLNGGGTHGSAPYIAPMHGGVDADVVALLRDPGPMADAGEGSGFLCTENDDSTAETMSLLLEASGVAAAQVTPWNVYPWYINRAPTSAELDAGLPPLIHLLDAVRPRIVLLLGRHADRAWARLAHRDPDRVVGVELVVRTYHPSRQALFHPDPEERRRRADHRAATFRAVGETLAERPPG